MTDTLRDQVAAAIDGCGIPLVYRRQVKGAVLSALAAVPALSVPGGLAEALPAPEPQALPERVVVGANGAYWRDYGDFYSMCPVSTDNDPIEPVAIYARVENPPAPTDDEPTTANGRDLLDHAVQYKPADSDRKVVAAKIRAIEAEAVALAQRAPERSEVAAGLLRLYDAAEARPDIRAAIQPFIAEMGEQG